MTRARAALLFAAFAAFVAYLNFLPFRFEPLEPAEALARFARIPYLNLGAGSRADWVANILMFLPLGWFAAAFFMPVPRRLVELAPVVPALVAGTAAAVAIEFAQAYFPNRTMSVNDIVAGFIGSLLGAVSWSAFGARSLRWLQSLLRGGPATVTAALAGYALAYLVLSFSPFDFVASGEEFAAKLASGLSGWWRAPVGCGRVACSLAMLVEAAAVVPIGWWWATRQRGGSGAVAGAAVLGAILGIAIELAQFLLVSGTSQGASVVSRAAGTAAGAWLYGSRGRLAAVDWRRWGGPIVLAGAIPYLFAVAYVAGWVGGPWLGIEAGLARAGDVEWMPFYYQYYSTEQALIRSTLLHLALYAPVGAAVWLAGRSTGAGSGWLAALLAAAIAVVAESGKLFIKGRHPDYTDVLIAMAAAWAAATLLRRASGAMRADPAAERAAGASETVRAQRAEARVPRAGAVTASSSRATATAPTPLAVAGPPRLSTSKPALVAAAALLLAVAVSLARFPAAQPALALGALAYAALLVRHPLAYLWAIPVAVPLLDLAPWSGRLFWDEFDLLVLTTLGARLLTALPEARAPLRLPLPALALLAASVLASAAVALLPPAPLDANAFASYLSSYNALRVGKGYLWAALLMWLLWRDASGGRDVGGRLGAGLALGLVAAVVGVAWERLRFVGMGELGADFRAAGMMSAAHVGGAYLEAMLIATTPFAIALAATRRGRDAALWLGVSLLGAAAVLMTLSRAAAAAWLVVVVAFAALWWCKSRWQIAALRAGPVLAAAAAATAGLAVLLAFTTQSAFLRDRLALTGSDLGVRVAHWRDTLDLMRGDASAMVLGMGLGSFPREFYLAQAVTLRLPAYRLDREPDGGRDFLALAGGAGMFVDQRVDVPAGREVLLRGELRASREPARLAVALCEKSFLTSVRCVTKTVPATHDWQTFAIPLALPAAAQGRFGLRAPVSLSLHSEAFGTRIDVTSLSLRDGPAELLGNGSFARAMDRWLMFSDVHLAWRALNTPVQVIFEQGLLGVLAWTAIGLAVLAATVRRRDAAALAAALSAALGLAAVGLFDTLLDSPRLVVVCALVLWLVLGTEKTVAASSRGEPGAGR